MQKARRHFISKLRPLVSVRFQVLFNFFVQDSFHLSFTVLVHYRSLSSIQPYQMVLAVSRKASPTPRYSGYCYPIKSYDYRAITLYGLPFQVIHLQFNIHVAVLQPRKCRNIYGLGSSHFARRYSGNHYYFLFLRLLRCFSSAGYPQSCYYQQKGFPIRKSADLNLLAVPHSLSQLSTSFFVSESLGIPRTPLVT